MTHSPELISGARAACQALDKDNWDNWDDLVPVWRDKYCQAFSAGLAALLPVSDDVEQVMSDYNPYENGKCKWIGSDYFTAAIKHLTSGSVE